MVLVILTDPNPGAALQRVLCRIGFVLLPVSILLIRYFPLYGRAYAPWNGEVMWTGVTAFKNGLGQTCLIYGLGTIWCFLVTWRTSDRRQRNRRLFAQAICVVTAIYLLWISDSKTSLACFVLAGGLMVAVSFSAFARRPGILHCMMLLTIAVPFAVLFLGVGQGALETMGRDPTLTGRTDIWQVVLRHVENPVVGSGYENFWLGARRERLGREIGVFFNQSHNGYLETYLNLGWVGVALLGSIIIAGYRKIVGRIRADPDSYSLRLAYFAVAIIYNFTEGAIEMMCSVWIAFLLATIAGSVPLHLKRRRPVAQHGHDRFRSDELAAAF
jgi:O-antigen ligase